MIRLFVFVSLIILPFHGLLSQELETPASEAPSEVVAEVVNEILQPEVEYKSYTIAGKSFDKVKEVRYQNRKLIFESVSGISSVSIQDLDPFDVTVIPVDVLDKIKRDVPLLIERLNKILTSPDYLNIEFDNIELMLNGTTIKNVSRVTSQGYNLQVNHAIGRSNINITSISFEEKDLLPGELQNHLERYLFYFRQAPEPEALRHDLSFSGDLDDFINEISLKEDLVLSIDPLIKGGVIPRNAQTFVNFTNGADIKASLNETFRAIDRRLGVFHVSEGVFYVSLEQSVMLQRALLSFMEKDFKQTQEWIELAGTGGTNLDLYLDNVSQILDELKSAESKISNLNGELSDRPKASDSDSLALRINGVRDDAASRVRQFLGFSNSLSFNATWVPPQVRKVTCESLIMAVQAVLSMEANAAAAKDEKGKSLFTGKSYVVTEFSTYQTNLSQILEALDDSIRRDSKVQVSEVIPPDAISKMTRKDFDSIKVLTDGSYSNFWDWDVRVLAGSLKTIGLALSEREFIDLLELSEGQLVSRKIIAQEVGNFSYVDKQNDQGIVEESIELDSSNWNKDVGLATGLVVISPEFDDIYGDTFVFAVDREADPKGAFSMKDVLPDISESKLKHLYYKSIEANLDYYALNSIKSAVLWAVNNKELEKLFAELKGTKLVMKLEQGMGVSLGGDSGGAAWASAIYSAMLNKPIWSNVAITGTVGEQGQIGKVGGIFFKVQGAIEKRNAAVFLPAENKEDLSLISPEDYFKTQIIGTESITDLTKFLIAKESDTQTKMYDPKTFPNSKKLVDSFQELSAAYWNALERLDRKEYALALWNLNLVLDIVPEHYSAQKIKAALLKVYDGKPERDMMLVQAFGFKENPPEPKDVIIKREIMEFLVANKFILGGLAGAFLVGLLFIKMLFGKRYS
ncbi:MAG: S16 family serine protease [Verrucomicrobiota bacterium]